MNYCPSNLLSGSPQIATFGTHSFETWNIEPLFWTLNIFNENMHMLCAIVLVYSAEWTLKHEFYQSLIKRLLKILYGQKRGGFKRFSSRFVLPSYTIVDTCFEHLKEYSHALIWKNLFQRLESFWCGVRNQKLRGALKKTPHYLVLNADTFFLFKGKH